MSSVLHLKTEEVDTPDKRGKYTVSVIGSGQRGLLYAVAFAEAGFKVICADADQSVVKRLSKGNAFFSDREVESKLKGFVRAKQLTATSELKSAVEQSDIIIVTMSPKIDSKKNPDYSETINSCKQVGAALRRGTLVVYGGIAGFGFTEGAVKETLENTSGLMVGEDFGLAYNPIQNDVTHGTKLIGEQELRVAAKDKVSLNATAVIYETIAKKGVKRISDVKAAELAVLFAATRRDVNVALANELAVFCENAGVNYVETLKLLDNTACETISAPTIAEEDNRNEAYLLLESAENLNAKLRVPALARMINEDMARHAINLTQEALRSCGKTLRRARVGLLGSAAQGTAATAFIELLKTKGAKVSRYDPQSLEDEEADGTHSLRRTLNETVEGTDCIVILAEQDQLKRLNLKKLRAVMKSPAALIDLAGAIEPSKVEEVGFTYRGLGRGEWKK